MPTPTQNSKVAGVMREFYSGQLYSSAGYRVTDVNQAKAIALSQAGLSRKGQTMKKKSTSSKPSKKKTTIRRRSISLALERADASIGQSRKTLAAAERREVKLRRRLQELDQLATGSLKAQLEALGYSIKPAAKAAKGGTSFAGARAQRDVLKKGKIVFTGSAHDVSAWLRKRHPDFAVKAARKGGNLRVALARTKQSIANARARIDRMSQRRGALLRQTHGG